MKRAKTVKKRTLVASIAVLCLCCAALIGATFAWFTDTASTGVNKIQAGKLDVGLQYYNGTVWADAEGQTLDWQKVTGHESETVLWEPGCTYSLQKIRVVNKENLALKYKIAITGIDGDAELNEAIEWTIKIGDTTLAYNSNATDYVLLPADGSNTGYSDDITISGHMKEDAGNEYQGLSINGIGITVYATQYTSEYDSTGNTYDSGATNTIPEITKAYGTATIAKGADTSGEIIIQDKTTDPTIKATIPTDDKNLTVQKESDSLFYEINTTSQDVVLSLNVQATEVQTSSVTYDVTMKNETENYVIKALSRVIAVEIKLGAGLSNVKVTHSGTAMTEATTEADGTYQYNSSTGILTIYTSSFSPFAISYTKPLKTKAEIIAAMASATSGDTLTIDPTGTEATNGVYYFGEGLTIPSGVTIASSSSDAVYLVVPYMTKSDSYNGPYSDISYVESESQPVVINDTSYYKYGMEITSSAYTNGTTINYTAGSGVDDCASFEYTSYGTATVNVQTITVDGAGCIQHDSGTSATRHDTSYSITVDSKTFNYTYICKMQ